MNIIRIKGQSGFATFVNIFNLLATSLLFQQNSERPILPVTRIKTGLIKEYFYYEKAGVSAWFGT